MLPEGSLHLFRQGMSYGSKQAQLNRLACLAEIGEAYTKLKNALFIFQLSQASERRIRQFVSSHLKLFINKFDKHDTKLS